MPSVQSTEFKGHQIWPGANSITPHQEGFWYYMVTVSYQVPNGFGHMSTSGLVAPRHKAQYGQIVEDILEFARQQAPGQVGTKVAMFFDIKPNAEYLDPYVVAQERQRAESERADQNGHTDEVAVGELMP
ncbi:hypothetical protein HOU95_gp063 [Streptomyces phage Hiyaa]|uniref:Uncharacterized protein n=1 Tax=Streptomyces phage Hiyaa TaxID=2499072 RepID=A0A3S9U8U3_9CAUD|nr:hypothetical protein HOU95_gp063 [Streptomyces phage Hiyaa]AZS06744.1 hypothetical protein SEA_HIYAA_105 [Streptomyces phage Hiyaa]